MLTDKFAQSTLATFQPSRWLSNPHLQTVYPALLRCPEQLSRRRERLELPDGDFVDLDWHGNDELPLAILLHGLAGSSRSGYVLGLQHNLAAHGIASVAINFRGCSGEVNRLARCYHSGETEDLDHVYRTVRQRFPSRCLAAVGFSLGGNVLLKWLGESETPPALFAAVAVSVPFVLSECANRLDSGLSRLYRAYLLRELKRYMATKLRYFQEHGLASEADKLLALGDLRPIRSFWQYDDQVVAPLHGFADVRDYYRRSSCRQFLPFIRTPTLLIHAVDDPFMTADVVPKAHELPPGVELVLQPAGGHVGFVANASNLRPEYWLDRCIPAYFLSRLARA